MATLKITLAVAIEAFMAAIAMANGSYKVAIMGTQLKSTKKLA